jgi:hypothetical protein
MRTLIAFLIAAFLNFGTSSQTLAQELVLPKPGEMISLSPSINKPVLKGIKIFADEPFKLEFILDGEKANLNDPALKEETSKLIKYFLAALTVPEDDLWVNLSPYEKDRIAPENFGKTEMGRDLLAQDYILKQITASLIYPESETGKKFWSQVYNTAQQKYGLSQIPVNTFNKVWIVPDGVTILENASAKTAIVADTKLKVMLEEDYLAFKKNKTSNALGSDIVRNVVLPLLEKEVNEGENFAQLRQIYHSVILAAWYKKRFKEGVLSFNYVDQNKVNGVNSNDPAVAQKIWERYVTAFKKGVFNIIKEEKVPGSAQPIARKYFSGGLTLKIPQDSLRIVPLSTPVNISHAMIVQTDLNILKETDSAMQPNEDESDLSLKPVTLDLKRLASERLYNQKVRVVVVSKPLPSSVFKNVNDLMKDANFVTANPESWNSDPLGPVQDWSPEMRSAHIRALVHILYDSLFNVFESIPGLNYPKLTQDYRRVTAEINENYRQSRGPVKSDMTIHILPEFFQDDLVISDKGFKITLNAVKLNSKYPQIFNMGFFWRMKLALERIELPKPPGRLHTNISFNSLEIIAFNKTEIIPNRTDMLTVFVMLGSDMNDIKTLWSSLRMNQNNITIPIFLNQDKIFSKGLEALPPNAFVTNKTFEEGAAEVMQWINQVVGHTVLDAPTKQLLAWRSTKPSAKQQIGGSDRVGGIDLGPTLNHIKSSSRNTSLSLPFHQLFLTGLSPKVVEIRPLSAVSLKSFLESN